VDYGCCAPVGVFVEVLRRRGVAISFTEARGPMGTQKREHIRRLLAEPAIAERWRIAAGALPTSSDVDALYAEAQPLQIEVLPHHADPIPGAIEAVQALRERGIGIGSSSGYTREMLDVLAKCSAALGYAPDVIVAATEVPEGRPAPFMNWEAAKRLRAWPASACVAVGDTTVDVEAGLNAGFWSIGVALTGNEVGLPLAAWNALPAPEQQERSETARARLRDAGAHLVLDGIAGLPAAIDTIEEWIAAGRKP
jgi:phosphonoacetaldehyde hydrolase